MTTRSKRGRETVTESLTQSAATATKSIGTCFEKSEHCKQPPQSKESDPKISHSSASLSMGRKTPSRQTTATKKSMLTLNHSRHRKRTKMTQLLENRRILIAAAAMEDQLASFEQQQTRNNDDFSSSLSFSAVSASSSSGSQCLTLDDSGGQPSPRHQQQQQQQQQQQAVPHHGGSDDDHGYERELAVLARSMDIQESRNADHGRQRGRRRRGGISVMVIPPR